MLQDAFDALNKLGLKRDEAKVYLACLRTSGGLFVHEITESCGVKRSTVDFIIDRLLAKNFLSRFREGRRHKYVAEAPDKLLFDFEKGLEDFRAFIPALMRLGANAESTRVTFHEGAKGVQSLLNDCLLTLKLLPEAERINYTVLSGRGVEKVLPRFHKSFVPRRVQSRIRCHMIAARDDLGQTWPSSAKEMRTTKMFDGKKLPLNIEIDLAGDKVYILSLARPAAGITIQNKAISTALRGLFGLVWDALGPPEAEVDGVKNAARK